MFQFQKLAGLFSSVRGAAEQEQAARTKTFQELVEVLVGVETNGDGKPPTPAEIKAALEAAGRDAGEMEREVGRLVEIHRLQVEVAKIDDLQAELRRVQSEESTERGRFEAQAKKHHAKIAELVESSWQLRGRLDALSQAKGRLEALVGQAVPMKTLDAGDLPIPGYGPRNVLVPDSKAGAAVRELYRWAHANRVPARCPVDPATIPAQAHLRRVSAQIAEFQSEADKHPDRLIKMPSRLSTEHDRLRAEIARAQKSWDVWHEYQRRQKEVDAMAVA